MTQIVVDAEGAWQAWHEAVEREREALYRLNDLEQLERRSRARWQRRTFTWHLRACGLALVAYRLAVRAVSETRKAYFRSIGQEIPE